MSHKTADLKAERGHDRNKFILCLPERSGAFLFIFSFYAENTVASAFDLSVKNIVVAHRTHSRFRVKTEQIDALQRQIGKSVFMHFFKNVLTLKIETNLAVNYLGIYVFPMVKKSFFRLVTQFFNRNISYTFKRTLFRGKKHFQPIGIGGYFFGNGVFERAFYQMREVFSRIYIYQFLFRHPNSSQT